MDNIISATNAHFEPLDCRALQLELDFFLLTQSQVISLFEICYSCLNELVLNSAISQWRWNNKKINKSTLFERMLKDTRPCTIFCEADIISDTVYDLKTFRYHENQIEQQLILRKSMTDVSNDYPSFFDTNFSHCHSQRQYKDAIFNIVYAKEKIMQAPWLHHDVMCYFSYSEYQNQPNRYFGTFNFCLGYYCLRYNAQQFAERLIDLAKKASTAVININGRIALSPIIFSPSCSGHMLYYYGNPQGDNSHLEYGVCASEWYKNYYSRGPEWFNIISPIQKNMLPNLHDDLKKYTQVNYEDIGNGAIALMLRKAIDKIDIDDLVPMKEIMYQSLYPGRSEILLENLINPHQWGYMAKIRQRWEYIPIFDDEVTISSKSVIISYNTEHKK